MTTARPEQVTTLEPRVLSDADAWAAIVGRDSSYDGVFVYAVRTTGVYCRPSCASRRALRANVEFFASPESAEARGYRQCKRCLPREVRDVDAEGIVGRAVQFIDQHPDESLTLERLGEAVGASPFHLQRRFKRVVGLTPRQYQDVRRVARLKDELRSGQTVSRATYEAGFGSSRAVYEKAAAGLGMSPATYRRGGAGLQIRYALAKSTLGQVMVAATDRGVCSVMLGDTIPDLVDALGREFPNADRRRDDGRLADWVAAIVEHADGARPKVDVPMDLQGTDFQLRVWRALQEIPYGDTRSYREIAAVIGQPSAARAVARACATNRAALLVPCHRVVREDGSPSGYRWGVERKRRLLERERG